jgi:hypothetical protein
MLLIKCLHFIIKAFLLDQRLSAQLGSASQDRKKTEWLANYACVTRHKIYRPSPISFHDQHVVVVPPDTSRYGERQYKR